LILFRTFLEPLFMSSSSAPAKPAEKPADVRLADEPQPKTGPERSELATDLRDWLASAEMTAILEARVAVGLKAKGAIGPRSFQIDGRRFQVNRVGRVVEVEDVN
jgi:hypothetical protein